MDSARGLRRALGALAATTLASAWLISSACTPEAEELARATIGPEGGTVSGGGVTVNFPAGAVAVETEVVLLTSSASLSVGDYAQMGEAVTIQPADLRLYLPAEITVEGGNDDTSVLVSTAERTVAHPGGVAHVEYLGAVALAATGTPTINLVEPELGSDPNSPAGSYVDNLHFEFDLEGTHRIDLVFTAWDYSGTQNVLNGEGHCGFQLTRLEGGSLTTGCASGVLTASINAAGDHVSFDVLPLHAPAIDEPVSVGVIAGDEEIGYSLGYFSFDTGSCYLEQCDGNGTCVDNGGGPSCECVEGFGQPPDDALSCVCVPQCEGRNCGSDSCGGSCGDCMSGEECDFEVGMCVPEAGTGDGDGDPTGDGDGDPTTGDGDGDPTTGDGDGDPTTGDGDGDMTTGDGDGDMTTGDGDGDMP